MKAFSRLFIVLIFICSSFVSYAQEMKIWVFIVGISEYEHFNNLEYADDDALIFETLLKQTLGPYYKKEQTKVLLNSEATSAAIESGMRWLLRNVKENDKVYFYFSGHGGFEDLTDFKLGYLHAHDAFDQTFSSGGNISLEFLQAFLQTLSLREVQTYFIADACHSGKSEGGQSGFVFLNNSLAKESSNIYKVLSAQGNEKSYENSKWGGGHGAFTYYLVKGMMGFADKSPEDGLVTLLELERYLFETVPSQTQYLQNPKVVANRKDMYLAKVNKEEFELYKKLMQDDSEVNLLESLSKGNYLQLLANLPDTAKIIYAKFEKSIKANKLIEPNGDNAFYYYQLFEEKYRSEILESMCDMLYITIMNQSQKYLNNSLYVLEDRKSYNLSDAERLHSLLQKLLIITPEDDPLVTRLLVREYYMEGEVYHRRFDSSEIKKRDYKSVLPNLMTAIELDSTAAYLYYNVGALYYHTKEYKAGLKYSILAAKLAPNWSAIYNNIGNIYDELKKPDSAIFYYELSVSLSPNYTAPYSNLAYMYLETTKSKDQEFVHNLELASKLFLKAGTIASLDDYYFIYAADVNSTLYSETHNPDYLLKAIQYYSSAESLTDKVYILKPLAKVQQKYYEDIDQEYLESYISYARYYAGYNKTKKAINVLTELAKLGFTDWEQLEKYPELEEFLLSEDFLAFIEEYNN